MDDNIAIKVENVSKVFKLPHEKNTSIKGAVVNFYRQNRSYEMQKALENVSFEINKGEFFGIVGRNGSGKSTLLKMLAGIYSPTDGNIHINGVLTPFIELGVGFSPELSGRENVFLNGALLGLGRKKMESMYEDIVRFAELKRFMDQKLKNYSSGMQVRLAFSIAIRAHPDILLLDEVLAVGDAAFQKKCFDYFMQLKKNKATVVLVTHDMGAVRQYCDRAIMINDGKIIETGGADAVAQAYQRLFSEDKREPPKAAIKPKENSHWGNGQMRCLRPGVKVEKEYVTLECHYKAIQNIPAPVVGFTIYGPTGAEILEGNTLRQKYPTKDMQIGDQAEIVWQIPNIFASGEYTVSVACCDQSTTIFYDWFNEAASFAINKYGFTAGIVDPDLTIRNYNLKRPSREQ